MLFDKIERFYNHGVRLRRGALWLFFALLLLISSAAAAAIPATNGPEVVITHYVLTAPFIPSWISIWFFSLMGGIGALFFKIDSIDREFRLLFIAKPFLGLFGAMAMCLILSGDTDPPEAALSAYGFFAALLSAPLLQALLAVASSKPNQAELFNKINPFRFKIVVPGDEPKQGGQDDKHDKY